MFRKALNLGLIVPRQEYVAELGLETVLCYNLFH